MSRLPYIEYLRALSVLYIVGYWHLFTYTRYFREYFNPYTNVATLGVLALFVFISGFLLSRSYANNKNLIQFYLRRVLRIYPLYALAVLAFSLLAINNNAILVKSLYFMSMLDGPAPYTLWFICMLMLLYLITPLLMFLLRYPLGIPVFAVTVIVLLITTSRTQGGIDLRLLLYFPCFCGGIYCAKYGLRGPILNLWTGFLLILMGLAAYNLRGFDRELSALFKVPLILGLAVFVMALCDRFQSVFVESRVVSFLSYGSFSLYLFHRPVYTQLKVFYFPELLYHQFLYLLLVGLPLAILVSWLLQKSYDKLYALAFKTKMWR
ncbi:MAG: peptidoglycan/LPS O-acetylase OafA/YrhL [Flavobacteriales bacterium]|jgi:peptidoglycan/LPS O-acetylase OafA/YrhL